MCGTKKNVSCVFTSIVSAIPRQILIAAIDVFSNALTVAFLYPLTIQFMSAVFF